MLVKFYIRITKLRENCGKEFEAHWQCLEKNNQDFYACRTPERTFNTCVFEKLVITYYSERCYHFNNNLLIVGFGKEDSWLCRGSRTNS